MRLKIGKEDDESVYIVNPFTHCLIAGASGTGKSALQKSLWEITNYKDCARIMIEPSGFLARECDALSVKKTHYCSIDNPVSLNPMAQKYNESQIVDTMSEALNQVLEVVADDSNLSISQRSLFDEAVRECLRKGKNNLLSVRDHIAKSQGNKRTTESLLNRLNVLLADKQINKILCGENPIEWGKFIQRGESFILDAHSMSKDKMVFLGTLITQSVKNYFRYAKAKTYHPLLLFIDEFRNFMSHNMFDVLLEGRKYKVSAIMATQDFSAIPEKLVKVMMNVGTIICFRSGYEVASKIAREIGPIYEDLDTRELIQTLPQYHFAYKTLGMRGIAKAPRPPYVKIKPVKPQVEPKRNPTGGWFKLEPLGSYQPAGSPCP